ncbi:MAG TPA: hypothetical protein VM680_17050 [Verrucomicrobiae bacterium]|nr:hypothetical protein [Verrucomicrobiae bacterium]
MELTHIYIAIAAIIVIGIDIGVRLRVAPRGRDAFYKALIEMGAGMRSERRLSPIEDEQLSLSHALLQVFQESFTSRQVIAALAKSPDGLEGKELEQHVRESAVEQWNRPLSINAIRRVILILMGANLVDQRDGKFAMTGVGWALHSRLETAPTS